MVGFMCPDVSFLALICLHLLFGFCAKINKQMNNNFPIIQINEYINTIFKMCESGAYFLFRGPLTICYDISFEYWPEGEGTF